MKFKRFARLMGFVILGLCSACVRQDSGPTIVEATRLFLNDSPGRALELCDEILRREPENVHIFLLRGEIFEAQQNTESAAKAYLEAVLLEPSNRLAIRGYERVTGTAHPARTPQVTSHTSLAYPNSVLPDVKLAGIDQAKPYRETVVEEATPKPRPSTFNERLMRSVAEGQKLDQQQDLLAEIDRYFERTEDAPTMDGDEQLPGQIVRFDFGLGLSSPQVEPISTTGKSRSCRPIEPLTPRRRGLFVGQSIPSAGRGSQRGYLCFPVNQRPLPQYEPAQPIDYCNDGRDNDGNLLADRADPSCWADGITPGSYNPKLVEGRLPPGGLGATATPQLTIPIPAITPPQPSATTSQSAIP